MSDLYTFDDFLLVPQHSELERNEIDITSKFFDVTMDIPIISSPMDTITGMNMLRAMNAVRGFGIHHRYCPTEILISVCVQGDGIAVCPSMGLDFIKRCIDASSHTLIAALDVAHGDTKRNLDFCEKMVKLGVDVISGNIATWYSAERYYNVGVKYMRVGIGSGSVCTTRQVTGVGYPQASAIEAIYGWSKPDVRIISDGGHRTTGDIVKALACGADFVMLGGMLAGTDEADGKNLYRGMASGEALSERKQEFFVEGISKLVEPKGSVLKVLANIKDAIEQACYYTGSENLTELRKTDKVFLSNSSRMESYVR